MYDLVSFFVSSWKAWVRAINSAFCAKAVAAGRGPDSITLAKLIAYLETCTPTMKLLPSVNYLASSLSRGVSWISGLALQVKSMVSRQECSNGEFVMRSGRRWQDLGSDMAE